MLRLRGVVVEKNTKHDFYDWEPMKPQLSFIAKTTTAIHLQVNTERIGSVRETIRTSNAPVMRGDCRVIAGAVYGGGQRMTHLDLLRERGAEHERLTIAHRRHRVLLDDAPDLRLKAHIEHPVGLVQHEEPAGTAPIHIIHTSVGTAQQQYTLYTLYTQV